MIYATVILAEISRKCPKLADHDSMRIELRGAIVELAPNLQMIFGIWFREQCGKFLAYALTRAQSYCFSRSTNRSCVLDTTPRPKI